MGREEDIVLPIIALENCIFVAPLSTKILRTELAMILS
jgi:hypothetical protein